MSNKVEDAAKAMSSCGCLITIIGVGLLGFALLMVLAAGM